MSSVSIQGNASGTGIFTIASPNSNTNKLFSDLFEYENGILHWTQNAPRKVRGKVAGGINTKGYVKVSIQNKRYGAHQIVFAMHHGYIPEFIDHINGIKSDNRIENLRVVTKSENGYNRKQLPNNTSGAKNVSYRADTNKWRVDVRVNGKSRCFGSYDDFELADLVAIEARNKYHGKFANHGGVC